MLPQMKLLIVTNTLGSGGKERQILELSKILLKNKINFKIICFSIDISVPGFRIIEDKLIVIDKNKGYFQTQKSYLLEIKKFRPDIVHVWDNFAACLSVIPKFFVRYRLIDGNIRGARRYFERIVFMLLTYPFTAKVVANSIAGLQSTYRNVNRKNAVIYNGFDNSRVENLDDSFDFTKDLAIADKKIVGMVANIRAAKDYIGFLKIAEIILKKRNDVAFVALGYGKINDELLQSLGSEIKDQIYFLGSVKNSEEYIKSFDIGLLLNDIRFGKEGISNSIMEYMAQGIPVVATGTGGTPEIVSDDVSGFLVPPYDYEKAAKKILFLIENENESRKMGDFGKEYLFDKFSLAQMEKEYLKLYTNLLD